MNSSGFKQSVQRGILSSYRYIHRSGLLSTAAGQFLFRHAYFSYKKYLEAGNIKTLQQVVRPGTWVIDVGANIGFFTAYFVKWVSEGGKVIAFEPEPDNYHRLHKELKTALHMGTAEIHQAAVDVQDGTTRLQVDSIYHGDHRIGTEGLPVPSVTLDTFLAQRNWPPVSLIKIDVEGAELRVLKGAEETMKRLRPSMFVEIDNATLGHFDAKAKDILTFLTRNNYHIFRLGRIHLEGPLAIEEALQPPGKGYGDLLFRPVELK